MKPLRIVLIFLIIITGSGFIIHKINELYTKEKIKEFAYLTAKSSTFNRGFNHWVDRKGTAKVLPSPLYLGSLLYANIHTQKPDSSQFWGGGKYTSNSYKDGWRKRLAENPELAFKALEEFGPYFIEEFNNQLIITRDSLLAKYENNASVLDSLKLFTPEKYWKRQNEIFLKYDTLVYELLKLDNSTLHTFIEKIGQEQYPCCGKGPAAVEVHAWLYFTKLIGKMPTNLYNYNDDPFTNGGWYYEKYPVDLLLFSYRMHLAYPYWQPRIFLTEVYKFSQEVQKILPNYEQEDNTDN